MNEELATLTLGYLVGYYKTHEETKINKDEIEAINFLLDKIEQLKDEIYKSNAVADTNKELAEKYSKNYQQLKLQYCERVDCSGRLGNSKKVKKIEEENQQLKQQIQQKEDIINEITNYCKFQIEKEQDKFPDLLESEKWLKGRISAFVEVLDMECIRDINKYQKDQENNIDLLLNKLQQREDTINKAKEHLQLKIIRYSNEINYVLNSTDLKEIIEILDNKGE